MPLTEQIPSSHLRPSGPCRAKHDESLLVAFARRFFGVSVCLVAMLASISAAYAAPAPTTCIAKDPVRITVAPSAFDQTLSRRVTEQLRSELSPRGSCQPAASSPHVLRAAVDVGWTEAQNARVSVVVETAKGSYDAMREIDFAQVPQDGRALAVGITADELLDALDEEASAELPDVPPPVVAVKPKPATVESAPKARDAVGSFGASFAYERFASKLNLYGPDARGAVNLGMRVQLGARLGVRAPAYQGTSRLGPSSAWLAGLKIQGGITPLNARTGASAFAGVDGVWLRGRGFQGHEVVAFVPNIGASVWHGVSKNFRLAADIHAGYPVESFQRSDSTGRSENVLSGVEFGASFGVVAFF